MATRVRKAFRKNLFGIVTMVISAAVLLGFLFSSEGLQSLNQISGNIRFLWLLGAFLAAVFAWVLEGLVLHLFCKKAYPEWKFHYSFCMGMVGVLYSALTPFPPAASQCRSIPCAALEWIPAPQAPSSL